MSNRGGFNNKNNNFKKDYDNKNNNFKKDDNKNNNFKKEYENKNSNFGKKELSKTEEKQTKPIKLLTEKDTNINEPDNIPTRGISYNF
jgi:hypothetical protein